jgi:hypothetical protein
MLDQSWLNEALGVGAEHPDPTRFGETATVISVVEGFLRNDAGFSREDIARYINEALQNEAADLLRGHGEALDVAEVWHDRADQELTELNAARATSSALRGDEIRKAASARFDPGRASLAEAVQLAERSEQVQLEAETRTWLVRLDGDKYFSEALGVDVHWTYAPILESEEVPSAPRALSAARRVDFSREAAPTERVTTPLRELQRDPNGPLAGARRAPELRAVVRPASTRAKQAWQNRFNPAEDDVAAGIPFAEPDVA